jgi:hypothetical protein
MQFIAGKYWRIQMLFTRNIKDIAELVQATARIIKIIHF